MAVTALAKPGDFATTFSLFNRSTPDLISYGITPDGKIYRARMAKDSLTPFAGGRGTWVDTGVAIPDVAATTDL